MSSEVHPLSGRLRVGNTGATYEILGKLATGGMAELFLARAPDTTGQPGPVVVLKRMLPHLAEDLEFVRMFRDEAQLALGLQHPNIVRALDEGPDDEHFFTMEYVHGEDLRALVAMAKDKGEHIPLAHLLTIMLGVTAALDHTHEQTDAIGQPLHIVHRDVSPTNVLISYDGEVKLLDFGVAKAAAGDHVTQAGTLKGKLAYMSPEQCRADTIDRRSDVFAVGILLYEMTTLTRLFAGENDIAVLHNVMSGVSQPPSACRRGYPPALEQIVLKALQSDPSQRYPTAKALHDDLARFGQQMGMRTSNEALARYLRGLFGQKPLPWQGQARLNLVDDGEAPTDGDRTQLMGDVARTQRFGEGRRTLVGHPGSVPARAPEAAVAKTKVQQSSPPAGFPAEDLEGRTVPSLTAMASPSPASQGPSKVLLAGLGLVVISGIAIGASLLGGDEQSAAAARAHAAAAPPGDVAEAGQPRAERAGSKMKPAEPPEPPEAIEPAEPIAPPVPEPDAEIQIPPEFEKPPEVETQKEEFRIVKIEGEGRAREAVLRRRDETTVRVRLGAEVDGYRVVGVNAGSVLLERHDGASKVTKRVDL